MAGGPAGLVKSGLPRIGLAKIPRLVVNLYLPEAEVAVVLGCSAGTVKSTASRGLARLREAGEATRKAEIAR